MRRAADRERRRIRAENSREKNTILFICFVFFFLSFFSVFRLVPNEYGLVPTDNLLNWTHGKVSYTHDINIISGSPETSSKDLPAFFAQLFSVSECLVFLVTFYFCTGTATVVIRHDLCLTEKHYRFDSLTHILWQPAA